MNALFRKQKKDSKTRIVKNRVLESFYVNIKMHILTF